MNDKPALIQIRQSAFDAVLRHCQLIRPLEACGLLFGTEAAFEKAPVHTFTADRFVPIANLAANPHEQFDMCPRQMTEALLTAPDQLIGIVHSHPSAEAVPSVMDLQTPWHTVPSHWILSFLPHTKQPVCVYQIRLGGCQFLQWEVV